MPNKPFIMMDAEKMSENLTEIVYARLRQFGKSYWIAKVRPWIHPYNTVRNCLAITLDGTIYYKFQVMYINHPTSPSVRFRVAEISKHKGFVMDVRKNQRLTYKQLVESINTAKVGY